MIEREVILQRLKDAAVSTESKHIELVYIETRTALSRFAENVIHQNIEQADHEVMARVSFGDRVGLAIGNNIEPEAIKATIRDATEIAENQDPDPDFPGLVKSPQVDDVAKAYYGGTAEFPADSRATAIKSAVDSCKKEGLSAAGLFKTGSKVSAVVNSLGTVAYFAETVAEFSLTASDDAASASGAAVAYNRDANKLDLFQLVETAVRKAVLSRNPQPHPAGEYNVILEPAAVGQLLLFMGFLGFSGKSFAGGRGFMAGKIGEKITGEQITIIEDPFAEEMAGMPFDYEGVPKKRVVLIENGVARAVVFNRRYAKKVGVESTGHALPPDNAYGPYPKNMALAPGTVPFEELVSSTDEGILITNFWYLNFLNPRRVQVTGTTRDGTFLIKKGKIDRPIQNMRATPAILESFANVEAIAKERIVYPQFASVMLVPGMKLQGFPLSEDTEEG